jgi:hypothetical protein
MSGVLLLLAIGDGRTVKLSGEGVVGIAIAGIRFNSDGTVDKNADGAYTQVDSATDWMTPNAAAPGPYSIRATLDSGDTPGGPELGSWHALTSAREWFLNSSGLGVLQCSLTIEISPNAGGSIVASNTYALETAT